MDVCARDAIYRRITISIIAPAAGQRWTRRMLKTAEVTKALQVFREVCKIYNCGVCPLYDADSHDCNEAAVKRVVMTLAAEYSESQYPTWLEWQKANFPDASDDIVPCAFMSTTRLHCETIRGCNICRRRPIPDEIAARLGIKPREGT